MTQICEAVLFCWLLNAESFRDYSPVHPDECGRGRGKGRAMRHAARGQRAHPQDPPIAWSWTYNPPAGRPFAEPSPGPTQS